MIVRIIHLRKNTWYEHQSYMGREYEVVKQLHSDWYYVKSTLDGWTLSIHKDDVILVDWRLIPD